MILFILNLLLIMSTGNIIYYCLLKNPEETILRRKRFAKLIFRPTIELLKEV